MKILVTILLMISSNAFAGKLKEITIMATESVEEYLSINDGDHTYQIINQDFASADENACFTIETKIIVRSNHSGRTINWTCLSHFNKTSEFFKISKTECKN